MGPVSAPSTFRATCQLGLELTDACFGDATALTFDGTRFGFDGAGLGFGGAGLGFGGAPLGFGDARLVVREESVAACRITTEAE